MRFDSVLIELSATPTYLFLIFAILLIVFHVVLVWLVPLADVGWKQVDYVWLGAAALGLLASSAQAGRELSRSYLEGVEDSRTASAYGSLRSMLASGFGTCAPRTRTEMSPPDFDQIVAEQRALCQWSRDNLAAMPAALKAPYPPLEKTGFSAFPRPVRYEPDFVRTIESMASTYSQQQRRYAAFVEGSKRSENELVYVVLSPLLIAFALALRITKVSGEIANARRKAAAAAAQPAAASTTVQPLNVPPVTGIAVVPPATTGSLASGEARIVAAPLADALSAPTAGKRSPPASTSTTSRK